MKFFGIGAKPKEEEKPASLSLEEVQKLVDDSIAKAISAKEEEDNLLSNEQKQSVTDFAKRLGKECLAKECFDKELNYSQSLEHIIEAVVAYAETIEKQFADFNSDADNAGEVDENELQQEQTPVVKTPGEAVDAIVKRDGCKRKEALEKAKVEYADVFKNWKGAR